MDPSANEPSPHATRVAAAAVGGLAALQTLPLWAAPYPVMQDLPAQTEMSCQLAHLWAGDTRFSDVLLVHGQPWANSVPTVVLALLLSIAPTLAMVKLVLSIVVVAWPVSLAVLFVRLGRSPWLALLCLPLTYDLAWSYGFLQYTCAKPLVVAALITAVAYAEHGRVGRGIALATLLVLTFVTHSLAWIVASACVTVLVVVIAAHARSVKHLARAWPVAAAALATLPFFLATRAPASNGASPPIVWREVGDALASAWSDLGDQRPGNTDAWPFVIAFVCVALVAIVGRRELLERARGRVVLACVAVVVLLGWLKGPPVLPQVSVVSPRLLSLGVAFALGALPAVRGRALAAVGGAMALAVALQVADTTRAYRAFARDDMGDFMALLDKAPHHARIATHYTSPFSAHGNHNALWHWGKLSCLTGGSFTDDLFAYRKTAYVEVRADRSDFIVPAHRMKRDALLRFDALLLRGDARVAAPVADVLEPLAETGTWHLYRIRRAPPE